MLRLLAINTGSNFATLFVKLTITFVMTPVFIRNLGQYDYGLWTMLMAVMGYAGMLEVGIGPTVSRYAAKLRAEEDSTGLKEVYSCALLFLGTIGLFLLVVFVLWGLWFPELLAPDGGRIRVYTLLLLILGVQVFFGLGGRVVESFLEGFQRYYLKNNITIVNSIIGSAIVYTWITPQNGLLLLALANTIGLAIKYLLFGVILASRRMGGLRPRFRDFSPSRLKELMAFGGKTFIQGVATHIQYGTDTLVIGAMIGPAAVPMYSVPANLISRLRGISGIATHPFMPLFSDLAARNASERIRGVYLTASKYVVGGVLPMSAGMCLVGRPFLEIWLGPEIARRADIIVPLLVAFTMAPMLNPFASRYLTALGRHGVFARWQPVAAAANLGLSIALATRYGIVGVAMGSVLPTLFVTPVFLSHSCRSLGIRMTEYLAHSIAPLLLPTALMAAAVALYRTSVGIDSYGSLLLAVLLGAAVYAPLFWITAVSPDERGFLLSRARGALGRA